MSAFVVVNPRAGRDWPEIRAALEGVFPGMSVGVSAARGQIAGLVRGALLEGHLNIIAVGGGGTLNEAVNGFFRQGVPLSPDAVLGFVGGGDFGRNFGIAPGWEAGVARLRKAHIRRVDVGLVSCLSPAGAPMTRCFLNAASFGLSGQIAAGVNRARFFPGAARWRAMMGWRGVRLRLIADGYDEIAGITQVVVGNGRWFGGAAVMPEADIADGFLDIAVMAGAPRWRSAPAVRRLRVRRLTAAATLDTPGAVAVETDGESAGLLPASFEIYPGALNLRC